MPSYNHERFVLQAINSIRQQTLADWELLVVDDGSNDGSRAVLATVNDPRVRITLLDRNRGACFAMNVALSQAQGAFIAVLNSDDVAHPDRLARQLQFIEQHPNVLAAFALPTFIDQHGQRTAGQTNNVFFTAPTGTRAQWLRHFIDNTNCLCHPTLFARRSLYEKAGVYDNSLVQLPDFDLWVRALQFGEIAVQRETLIDFRVLGNGGNASAPTIPALMRCQPELYWIARQFFRFPDALLAEAFADVNGAPGDAAAVTLIKYLIAQNRPYSLMAALDATREQLLISDSPALREVLLSWTGSCDPFGLVARSRAAPAPAAAGSFAAAFGRRGA